MTSTQQVGWAVPAPSEGAQQWPTTTNDDRHGRVVGYSPRQFREQARRDSVALAAH